MKTGTVIQSTGAVHLVESDGQIYSCTAKGKLRLKGFRNTNPVAVGDLVNFEQSSEESGIIQSIHARRNCIIRKSINLSKESQVIAANIDQAVFVFTLKNPITTTVFTDRFLAAAESYSIPPVIIFNKSDIYTQEEIEELAGLMSTYHEVGYRVVACSVLKNKNLDEVREVLKDKVSVIAGHSGAGKTSLINSIAPGVNLKTEELSESHLSGKHTTTFARMLKLPFGGAIIDTPGIRGFGLVHLKKEETGHYFPEIFEKSHNCRYNNCTHSNEPGCAVKEAVEKGEISWTRYHSYLNILLDEDDKHRMKEV